MIEEKIGQEELVKEIKLGKLRPAKTDTRWRCGERTSAVPPASDNIQASRRLFGKQNTPEGGETRGPSMQKTNNLITVMRAAALYHCDPRGIASLVHHRNSIILSRRFSGPPSASQMKSAFITNAPFKSTFCTLSHYSPFLSPAATSR